MQVVEISNYGIPIPTGFTGREKKVNTEKTTQNMTTEAQARQLIDEQYKTKQQVDLKYLSKEVEEGEPPSVDRH